ncbi:MAG: efflux RND transporter permease subunit [Gemmataceae bacterium]|nr:efflux RND transporter permease subunit [Gemmataceae bacterium]MDW8264443.1 efflux RND transporter permease subunit [Gemmataceae bacterium]
MLNALIHFSLRHRPIIVVLSLAILVGGGYVAATLPIDVFPDLDRPRVVVQTECPGLAAEEVESLVTYPLESALLGAPGVQTVRSQSVAGLSAVIVEFDWGTDIRQARLMVQGRLESLPDKLPAGIQPQMMPLSSILGQVMQIGLTRQAGPRGGTLASLGTSGLVAELTWSGEPPEPSLAVWQPTDRHQPHRWEAVAGWSLRQPPRPVRTGWSASVEGPGQRYDVVFLSPAQQRLDLRTTADWIIRPQLLKVPGVAQVVVMGGDRKQYQVLVDPHALLQHAVSLQDVSEALRRSNLNASGGYALQDDREVPIRILGRLGPGAAQVLGELEQVPIKPHPRRPILLSQVARVVEGPQLKRGDASVNGMPAVVLTVTKQPHVDTRALTDRLHEALAAVEASLPPALIIHSDLFQMKRFIDRGIYNVAEALAIGAALVLLILFLFLLNFRTTFISLSAIPLSLAMTMLVFRVVSWLTHTELSINVMTLGGIAVAMGELVDDAIVDVENIFRRLRENLRAAAPRPVLAVIEAASIEVRGAIVFGTMMVILVFLPLFALSGMEGRLFTPLGVAYITSILASLLVSLTVTPVLSSYLLPRAKATHRAGDSPLLRWLKAGAGYLVRFSLRRAGSILLVTWLGVGLAALALSLLGADFLPPFDEGSVQVNLTLPPGSSLEASNQISALADAKFRQMQVGPGNPQGEILTFVRRSGRAEQDEHVDPVSNTEYILNINPNCGRSRDEVLRAILEELREEIPGVDIEAEQPLAHLISHMLSGVTAPIAVKVFGDDLDVLRRIAERIRAVLGRVPGITPPVVEAQQAIDEQHIRLRPDQLAFYGLDRATVADFLSTALQGATVGQVIEGQRRFDLVVRLDDPFRTDLDQLLRLRLELPDGRGSAPLSELVEVRDEYGPNVVQRENLRRRIVVRCHVQGRDLASVVADIRRRIDADIRPNLPTGYFIELGGQFESQQRATWLIGGLGAAALLAMFGVLYLLFPSARIVLQILNALPTAFIGAVIALLLTGQTLTVASLVGFVSLGGIAARNGILLVTHYIHLMKHEGESFTPEMIVRGSLERLAPVLMTALTAGIGLVPLVVGGHQPGREILYPVATVILGGLVTSTFCEFLVHPGLFWRFSGGDGVRLAAQATEE